MQYILTEQEYNKLIHKNINIKDLSNETNIDNNNIVFSKEKAMQLLCCLGSSMYNNQDFNKEQRHKLIEMNNELSWDIAERYDLDINEGFIDVNTLKYKEFKDLED